MTSQATNPPPTKDLCDPSDVEDMVRRFYGDVAQDNILGPLFNDVAQVDWSAHIPKLSMFWNRALFGLSGYAGNPFQKHRIVHETSPFSSEHFERWLQLFHETIDLYWAGPVAEQAKELARNVARVHSTQLIGEPVVFVGPNQTQAE